MKEIEICYETYLVGSTSSKIVVPRWFILVSIDSELGPLCYYGPCRVNVGNILHFKCFLLVYSVLALYLAFEYSIVPFDVSCPLLFLFVYP
jgi:hypothetical protein